MYGGTTLDRYLLDKLNDKTMGSTSYLSKPRLGVRSAYNANDKENNHGKNKKARLRKSAPKMSEYGIRKRLPDYTELAYKEAVSRLRYFLSETYAPSSRSSKVGGAPSLKNLEESGDEGYDLLLSRPKYTPLNLYSSAATRAPLYLSSTPAVSRPTVPVRRYPLYSRDNYKNYSNPDIVNSRDAGKVYNKLRDHTKDDSEIFGIEYKDLSGISQPIVQPVETASQGAKAGAGSGGGPADSELMGFIQKQEEYIEQLERESSYCRDELNSLLSKVKEVISENETLHEKQKNHLITSVMEQNSAPSDSEEEDHDLESDVKYSSLKPKKSSGKSSKRMEGPNIVFESKISELEAQLTQANIDLKKLQDENSDYRRKLSEGIVDSPCLDSFKRQIENLQRDKSSLEAQVSRLNSSLEDCRDTDSDLVSRAKRSADMAYQANNDKVQLEMEIRRLKEELERQQVRVRELLAEQARRVMDERSAVERRYCTQVEQLTSDLTTHWDSATKLQLELERQKREEGDLKRELSQKNSQIEELKLELKNKVASLQADIAQAHADKSALEEELANARLMLERHQRQAKHDSNRLNSEIQSVRQRLDRADADLVHSRRENLRLIDQLANMEKEMNLRNLRPASPTSKDKDSSGGIKEKELSNMIQNMESKHAQTVSELEAMVCSQNSLMEKLTAECHLLTSKLDDASQRHKTEKIELIERNAELMRKLRGVWLNYKKHCPAIHRNALSPIAQTPTSASNPSTSDNSTTERSTTANVSPYGRTSTEKNSQRDAVTDAIKSTDNMIRRHAEYSRNRFAYYAANKDTLNSCSTSYAGSTASIDNENILCGDLGKKSTHNRDYWRDVNCYTRPPLTSLSNNNKTYVNNLVDGSFKNNGESSKTRVERLNVQVETSNDSLYHALTSSDTGSDLDTQQEMATLQNKLELLSARVSQTQINTNLNNSARTTHNTSPARSTSRNYSPTQNSARNDNQYPDESINYTGQPARPRHTDVEPDQRRLSRQSSRNGRHPTDVIEHDPKTREQERFEKKFKESEPSYDASDTPDTRIPPNSPQTARLKYNLDQHRVDENKHRDSVSEDDKQYQEPSEKESRYDELKDQMDYSEVDRNAYDERETEDSVQPVIQEYIEPTTEYTDPSQQYAEQDYPAEQQYVDQQYVNPNDGEYTDPNQQYVDPNQEYSTEPDQQYVDPNQEYVDPNQQYIDPSQQYIDPNQQYTDPNQQYTDPNQQYTDPNQQYIDPNQQYTDPNQQYTDPNQEYTDPNQQYVDPNQGYESQSKEDTNVNQQYTEDKKQYPEQRYSPKS